MFIVILYLWSGGECERVEYGTFPTWEAAHEWAYEREDTNTDYEIQRLLSPR